MQQLKILTGKSFDLLRFRKLAVWYQMAFLCYATVYFHSDFKISRFTIGVHISCVLEKTLKGGKVYGKEIHKRICYESET